MTPVFLTSLTTAIGFLSMNLSDAPPFWHLGNITAVGVTAAFIYSVLFLPALMSILPVRSPKRATAGSAFFERLAEFVIAKRSPLLWGSAAVVILLAAFLPRNVLNDQFVNYFGERIQFRQDTDFTMQNLTGLYQVEFSLGTQESGGISDPNYLQKLDDFETWLKQQPEVVHVSSFSQIMKRINTAT